MDAPVAGVSPLVDQREVLSRCGISRQTLHRWIASSLFPGPLAAWPGKSPRWRRTDLEKFFSEMK